MNENGPKRDFIEEQQDVPVNTERVFDVTEDADTRGEIMQAIALNQFSSEAVADREYPLLDLLRRQEKMNVICMASALFSGERVRHSSGYFKFPEIHPRSNQYKLSRQDAENTADKLLYQALDKPFAELSQEEQAVAKILVDEYKIHLMPQEEHIPHLVKELISAIETDENLQESLYTFKVIDCSEEQRKVENKKEGTNFPIIVVYPEPGKEHAQRALDSMLRYLGKYVALGIDDCPEYNQKVNTLIFYAQGSRDQKKRYQNNFLRGKERARTGGIYDEDFIHFKGDYKLQFPKITNERSENAEVSDQ